MRVMDAESQKVDPTDVMSMSCPSNTWLLYTEQVGRIFFALVKSTWVTPINLANVHARQ